VEPAGRLVEVDYFQRILWSPEAAVHIPVEVRTHILEVEGSHNLEVHIPAEEAPRS